MVNSGFDLTALTKHAWSFAEIPTSKRTASDFQPFFDSLTEDVVWRFDCPKDTPILGPDLCGKQAVREFLTVGDPEYLEDAWLEGQLDFFGDGNRVVVVGRESYTPRVSGVTIHDKGFAMIHDFRHGLISRILWIGDVSEFVAAYKRGKSTQASS